MIVSRSQEKCQPSSPLITWLIATVAGGGGTEKGPGGCVAAGGWVLSGGGEHEGAVRQVGSAGAGVARPAVPWAGRAGRGIRRALRVLPHPGAFSHPMWCSSVFFFSRMVGYL